jgi:hypothetical protein
MGDPANQAKAIFLEAIEQHPPQAWPAFLEQACAGDVQLRAEVDKLLRAYAAMGSFHEAPRSAPTLSATADEPVAEHPGTRIGPYNKKLSQLCRGELDWIVMKALDKDRNRRYETVSDFAADVQRYLHDEPVQACPPSAWYRYRKFARRNKRVLATLAMILVAVVTLTAGLVWAWWDRERQDAAAQLRQALTEQAFRNALEEAEGHRARLHKQLDRRGGVFGLINNPRLWHRELDAARAALEHAEAVADRAEAPLPPDLLARAQEFKELWKKDQAECDLALALEKVRMDRSALRDSELDSAAAQRDYPEVFRKAGLDVLAGDAADVVRRIQQFAVKEQLVAALDDWALVTVTAGPLDELLVPKQLKERRALLRRLLSVCRQADPGFWKDQIRQNQLTFDPVALQKFAAEASQAELSPSTLVLVGHLLLWYGLDLDAVLWLERAKFLYPSDFWINFTLSQTVPDDRPEEQVG